MSILIFDTETDGVEPLECHIVSATLMKMAWDGSIEAQQSWLLDFGGEIPEGASAVHDISTEHMREHGTRDIKGAIEQIYAIINNECANGAAPLVAYNAAFDLTLLETERLRHSPGIAPLSFMPAPRGIGVIDPLVIDKAVDRYRKGSRKLVDTARHYGVAVDESKAHDAAYDCWLTGRVAIALSQVDRLRGMPLDVVHEAEVIWRAEQAAGLQHYFRTKGGKPDAVVDGAWPFIPRAAVQAVA